MTAKALLFNRAKRLLFEIHIGETSIKELEKMWNGTRKPRILLEAWALDSMNGRDREIVTVAANVGMDGEALHNRWRGICGM